MKRLFKYVEESEDLKRGRILESAMSWRTLAEANSDLLDLSKDWTINGQRCGVPESYSHKYDAQVSE